MTRIVVLDDVASKGDQMIDAAHKVSTSTGQDVVVEVLTHPANLVEASPGTLAEIDAFLIDFELRPDRYGHRAPTVQVQVTPNSTVDSIVTTGMGSMVFLAQIQSDPRYLAARAGRPLPLVYSYVDIAEPHSRYFESAAATWFGAPLFQGVNERALAERQLVRLLAAARGEHVDADLYSQMLRPAHRTFGELFEPLGRGWLTARGRDPFTWMGTLLRSRCGHTKGHIDRYRDAGLIRSDARPNQVTQFHDALIATLYTRVQRFAEAAGVLGAEEEWPEPKSRDNIGRESVREALLAELEASRDFWTSPDVALAMELHRNGGLTRFRAPH